MKIFIIFIIFISILSSTEEHKLPDLYKIEMKDGKEYFGTITAPKDTIFIKVITLYYNSKPMGSINVDKDDIKTYSLAYKAELLEKKIILPEVQETPKKSENEKIYEEPPTNKVNTLTNQINVLENEVSSLEIKLSVLKKQRNDILENFLDPVYRSSYDNIIKLLSTGSFIKLKITKEDLVNAINKKGRISNDNEIIEINNKGIQDLMLCFASRNCTNEQLLNILRNNKHLLALDLAERYNKDLDWLRTDFSMYLIGCKKIGIEPLSFDEYLTKVISRHQLYKKD